MDLKQSIQNHQETHAHEMSPQPEVWDSLSNHIKSKRVARRAKIISLIGVASLLAIGGAILLLHPAKPTAVVLESEAVVAKKVSNTSPNEVNTQEATATTPSLRAAKEPAAQTKVIASARQPESAPHNTQLVTAGKIAYHQTNTGNMADKNSAAAESNVVAVDKEQSPSVIAKSQTESTVKTTQGTKETKQNVKASTQADENFLVLVPNAFSPNDPISSQVRIFKATAMEGSHLLSFKMMIYNRAGQMLFSSSDINHGWDGTHNGKAQPMGNYVCIIEYKDAFQGLKQKKTSVTLIR